MRESLSLQDQAANCTLLRVVLFEFCKTIQCTSMHIGSSPTFNATGANALVWLSHVPDQPQLLLDSCLDWLIIIFQFWFYIFQFIHTRPLSLLPAPHPVPGIVFRKSAAMSSYNLLQYSKRGVALEIVQTLSEASSSFRHVPDAPREACVVDPGNIWLRHMFS